MNERRFTVVDGPVVWLPFANIDTDQIIPARFLKQPRASGYGQYLFHDILCAGAAGEGASEGPGGGPGIVQALAGWRGAGAEILAAGDNFGCGSSREAAVYALLDAGVRCVLAPGFGDIFRINCMKNGLLPVVLGRGAIVRLLAGYGGAGSVRLVVDLAAELVRSAAATERFAIEAFWKECLLLGIDEIDMTMRRMAGIERYATGRLAREPWLVPPAGDRGDPA